jgi:hypothetical protein
LTRILPTTWRGCLDLDGEIVRAFRLTTPHMPAKIGLLFVITDTPEIGFQPLSFGPSPRTCGRWMIMADVSQGELERIQSGDLPLPDGWALGREINLDA